MGGILKLKESSTIPVEYVTTKNCDSIIIFFQKAITNNDIIHTSVIFSEKNDIFLLLYRNFESFLLNIKDVNTPLFERFFLNLKICIDIDKELAVLMQYLPLEKENISDFKIAKGLLKNSFIKNFESSFQMGVDTLQQEINLTYLKSLLIKMITSELNHNDLLKKLQNENKLEIYYSIIAENFYKTKEYEIQDGNLEKISALYQALPLEGKTAMKNIYNLVCDTSKQCGVPNSNILNLNALENLMVGKIYKFEDIINAQGLNKKYIHNAVIRKISGHLMKIKNYPKRDSVLESLAEVILLEASATSGIEKNFIATKHEIIAFFNQNSNVDFLKGWKKSIFGKQIVDFLENRSYMEVQNNKLYIKNI